MGVNEARESLRQAVRGVWSDPSMEGVRQTLAADTYSSGFASCLKQEMMSGRGGKQSFEKCAQTTDISGQFKGAWGKPSALMNRRR